MPEHRESPERRPDRTPPDPSRDDPIGDPDELEELGELDEEARRYDQPEGTDQQAG